MTFILFYFSAMYKLQLLRSQLLYYLLYCGLATVLTLINKHASLFMFMILILITDQKLSISNAWILIFSLLNSIAPCIRPLIKRNPLMSVPNTVTTLLTFKCKTDTSVSTSLGLCWKKKRAVWESTCSTDCRELIH